MGSLSRQFRKMAKRRDIAKAKKEKNWELVTELQKPKRRKPKPQPKQPWVHK